MSFSTSTKINILKQPTQFNWIELAIASLDTILLDRSHCERKVASAAINMMFRYPSYGPLVRKLTAIAQEELEHFEQVNQWLDRRGIALAPLNAPPYGAHLKAQIRRQEPERLLDSLLISALIEARSHERLGLLGQHWSDPQLQEFYQWLTAAEERHLVLYLDLALAHFPEATVTARLTELIEAEAEILAELYPQARIHS
ncbi:MAG: tRNA-(ms[2]io[6]A)-hydroxylase [Hydrococcus sp. RM1_1_31]|nr:tRNA-(ms[2]io[6]A)-hydroxylase [Hydrococcus sp. RM1_1_31]